MYFLYIRRDGLMMREWPYTALNRDALGCTRCPSGHLSGLGKSLGRRECTTQYIPPCSSVLIQYIPPLGSAHIQYFKVLWAPCGANKKVFVKILNDFDDDLQQNSLSLICVFCSRKGRKQRWLLAINVWSLQPHIPRKVQDTVKNVKKEERLKRMICSMMVHGSAGPDWLVMKSGGGGRGDWGYGSP